MSKALFLKSLLFVLLTLKVSFSSAHTKKDKEITLKNGSIIAQSIAPGETHSYNIHLQNGEALIAEVVQESADVVIEIQDDNGVQLSKIDGWGKIENIDLIAEHNGNFKLLVTLFEEETNSGDYKLQVKNILSLSENAKRIAKREIQSKQLYALWEASLQDKNAVDTFLSKNTERHLIEEIEGAKNEMLVTYFYTLETDTDYVMQSGGPDFLGLRFHQLGATKLHFASHRVAKDARFNYGFNHFKFHKAGANAEVQYRQIDHVYDGTVVMPLAPKQSYITKRAAVAKGELKVTSLQSTYLDEERKITVYTPAGYDTNQKHNLLVVFDGEAYGARPNREAPVPTPTILDNLNAENKLKPTVAILVWQMGKRDKDLISATFSNFIAKELLPWARKNYSISEASEDVVLAGSSRGGFAASYIALNHSNVIGNVLSQSGSYWIKGSADENHWMYPTGPGKLIEKYKQSPLLPIKFYMDIGRYDAGASMLGMNREFHSILELKGYQLDYREFNGGHSYVNWRGTLSDGLLSLLGKK
ncbi:MAG: alpha/beta hydrolase [Flavicella sp.]